MRIAIIGTGYVGLVSGACFSDFGHDVICVDKDKSKIDALERNVMPIFEPGLDDLVARNVRQGRLSFTTDLAEGVEGATPCSSRSARRRGAATGMPTCPTSTAPRVRSPGR
jgi:UDPglucose 6-dehydrogenase